MGYDGDTSSPTFGDPIYGWIYKMERPPGGVDVVEVLGSVPGHEDEVAFERTGIPNRYIKTYRKIEGETSSGQPILGPELPFYFA